MRIWHLIVAVIITAVVLSLAQDNIGRVALIVFVAGLIEFACGTAAIMALFRTVGAIGHARGLLAYAEAVIATCLVLFVASLVMNSTFWLCAWLLQRVVV